MQRCEKRCKGKDRQLLELMTTHKYIHFFFYLLEKGSLEFKTIFVCGAMKRKTGVPLVTKSSMIYPQSSPTQLDMEGWRKVFDIITHLIHISHQNMGICCLVSLLRN